MQRTLWIAFPSLTKLVSSIKNLWSLFHKKGTKKKKRKGKQHKNEKIYVDISTWLSPLHPHQWSLAAVSVPLRGLEHALRWVSTARNHASCVFDSVYVCQSSDWQGGMGGVWSSARIPRQEAPPPTPLHSLSLPHWWQDADCNQGLERFKNPILPGESLMYYSVCVRDAGREGEACVHVPQRAEKSR